MQAIVKACCFYNGLSLHIAQKNQVHKQRKKSQELDVSGWQSIEGSQ